MTLLTFPTSRGMAVSIPPFVCVVCARVRVGCFCVHAHMCDSPPAGLDPLSCGFGIQLYRKGLASWSWRVG